MVEPQGSDMNIIDMHPMKIKLLLISIFGILFSCGKGQETELVLAQEFNFEPEKYELKLYQNDYQVLKDLEERGIKFINKYDGVNPYCIIIKEGRVKKMIINAGVNPYLDDLARFGQLEELVFMGTDLKSLSDLPEMKQLRSFSIFYAKYLEKEIEIPSSIKNVEELKIVSCKIESIIIPESNQLKSLMLLGNEITRLNDSFLNLRHLKILVLSGNKLKDINVSSLPKLELLELLSNPISDIKSIRKKHPLINVEFDIGKN